MTTFTIKDKVANKLRELSKNAFDSLVNQYAMAEYDKRVASAVIVYDMLTAAERELTKASKPDVVHYTQAGKEVANFSKAQIEARKKAAEKVEKISKALSEAFDEERPDWTKLLELQKQAASSNKQETPSA